MKINETYVGLWWFPEDIENKFQGILQFEPNGTFILNILKQSTSIDFEKIFRSRTVLPSIIGLAKEISTNIESSFRLLDAYIFQSSLSRLSSFKIKTVTLLKSRSSEFSSDLKFDTLNLKTDFIDDWFNIYGYDFSMRDIKKSNFKLEYLQPEPITLYSSNDFDIEAFFSISHNLTFDSVFSSDQSVFLNLNFKNPKSFEELKEFIRKIRDFYTLCFGIPVNISKSTFIKVVSGEKSPDIHFDYYQKRKYKSTIPTSLRNHRMLINYDLIKDFSQEVFSNWFEKYNELKFLIKNYFGSLYNEYKYVEDEFLNYVFGIEVYHRAKYGGFDLKNKAYLEIRERVLSCVSNSSDKQWLESRLNRYTENTLNSRLSHILEINKVSLTGLIEDENLFLKQVVETRHFHVHSFVQNNEFVLREIPKLSMITKKLGIIIQAILMFELGFNQEIINERLKKNSPFQF